jgi:hypothetical protein
MMACDRKSVRFDSWRVWYSVILNREGGERYGRSQFHRGFCRGLSFKIREQSSAGDDASPEDE